jgi:arsenate reductase-like glutaredoxin family protein
MEDSKEIESIVRNKIQEIIKLDYSPKGFLLSEGQALRLNNSFSFYTAAMIALGIKPSAIEQDNFDGDFYWVLQGHYREPVLDHVLKEVKRKENPEIVNQHNVKDKILASLQVVEKEITAIIDATRNAIASAFSDDNNQIGYQNSKNTITREELKTFLDERGIYPEFFTNTENGKVSYLNKDHAHYAEELAIAVDVWTALAENPSLTEKKSPKKSANTFLREKYPNLSENSRDRISTLINWSPAGGAPKT